MSNTVNIRVDSRVFYGLVALIAVVGIFAIGIYLGGQFTGGETTTATQQDPAANPVIAEQPAGNPPGVVQTDPQAPPPQDPMAAAPGSVPVSPDEVPVEAGQPRIALPELVETNYTYEFGSISPNEKVERDFVIRNVGEGVLEISDASASCGCTAALVADTTVDPGEETTIRVGYDPRVNQESGKFVTKQIRVKSNDPLVPLAEFTITADVQSQ